MRRFSKWKVQRLVFSPTSSADHSHIPTHTHTHSHSDGRGEVTGCATTMSERSLSCCSLFPLFCLSEQNWGVRKKNRNNSPSVLFPFRKQSPNAAVSRFISALVVTNSNYLDPASPLSVVCLPSSCLKNFFLISCT